MTSNSTLCINNQNTSSYLSKIQNSSNPQIHKPKNKFSLLNLNDSLDDLSSSIESSEKEQNEQQMKYRTELCKFYEINGQCKFGDGCMFAHGKENLREKTAVKSGYKKRACINFFEHGFCMYGNRCQFSHKIIRNDKNNRRFSDPQNGTTGDKSWFSYKTLLNDISKGKVDDYLITTRERKRLEIFRSISNSGENYKNKNNTKNKKDSFITSDYIKDIKKLFLEK
jgi:hypothetical protein